MDLNYKTFQKVCFIGFSGLYDKEKHIFCNENTNCWCGSQVLCRDSSMSSQWLEFQSLIVVNVKRQERMIWVPSRKVLFIQTAQSLKHSSFQSQHNLPNLGSISPNPSPGLPLQPPPISLVKQPHPRTRFEAVQHAQVLYSSVHFYLGWGNRSPG